MSLSLPFFNSSEIEKYAFICLGNIDRADDAFGILVGEKLSKIYPNNVYSEKDNDISVFILEIIENKQVQHVFLIDAVDFHGKPGELILKDDFDTKITQISTHTIPYEQIKNIIETKGKKFTLLGAQFKDLTFLGEVSKEILDAVEEVSKIFS
ncbi:MAG: hydrogenase maturation protease [Candidatus Heimdallarchaeaceae archaeon]